MTAVSDIPLDFDSPSSLADQAYIALRDQLIMLEIPPLAPIDDEGLSARLGLGRTPVREALKRLETERLVISYPRRGTFATAVDISDLTDVCEIRLALEPLAARRAALAASAGRRDELRALADRIRVLDSARTGRTELMRWDVSVHRSIYRAAGNPYLEDTLTRYYNLATRIHCMFLERLDHVAGHVDEHCELLYVIADGDARRAESVCRQHVEGFEKAIRAVL
ncbi:GntR family transcriptional regulator [Pseudonocardia sp. C8]|uniref:GntR family transcriptional regulator n=1 Tax=Pseudonocardia sp. C8 TaxID=2762759 RepID=UPI001642D47A|nr:GntR family transcriptional regulator [Pseudonocardia sp. C8]MBC3190446.1 GntR family transcriptional regulator [Pseudonocardia sp. C8]